MGKVKLNDMVTTPTGEITTISSLAARGLVKFSKSDNFMGKRGKIGTHYFADLIDGSGSWEIGAEAYASRSGYSIF